MTQEDDSGEEQFQAQETLEMELHPVTAEEMALLLSKPVLPPKHPERLDQG